MLRRRYDHQNERMRFRNDTPMLHARTEAGLKHPVSRELFSYWDHLRKGRSAPERAEVDPAAIRSVLSDTFILGTERDGSRTAFPVRLSGTRLNALFLAELKGRSLLDLWVDDDQPSMTRIFETVLDDTAPVVAGLRGSPSGYRPVDFEMVLLPLRTENRFNSRILGAIAPMNMPSWLGLAGMTHVALTSLRLIQTAEPEPQPVLRRVGDKLDAGSAMTAPRRYGRFTVHEGGR